MVKNVTVSVVAGQGFASVQTEQQAEIAVNRGPAVGIDLGSAQAMVLSDESVIRLPRTSSADRKRWRTRIGWSRDDGRARAIAKRENAEWRGCRRAALVAGGSGATR